MSDWNNLLARISLENGLVRAGETAAEDIGHLEELAGRDFPVSLRSFYETIGGFGGVLADGTLSIKVPSSLNLIESFSSDAKPYQKLTGLGLHDMIQLSWSNGKISLKPEGGFEQVAIDVVNEYLCVGWFGDGGCEAFAYIIQVSPDRFGAYCWHQDDELPDPDGVTGFPLEDLFDAVFDVFDEETKSGEEASFDIRFLGRKLNG